MEISLDAFVACLSAGSWVQCCCRAGLLRLDGCWLEMTEYLAACFAGPAVEPSGGLARAAKGPAARGLSRLLPQSGRDTALHPFVCHSVDAS
jgi:hypothetical protein